MTQTKLWSYRYADANNIIRTIPDYPEFVTFLYDMNASYNGGLTVVLNGGAVIWRGEEGELRDCTPIINVVADEDDDVDFNDWLVNVYGRPISLETEFRLSTLELGDESGFFYVNDGEQTGERLGDWWSTEVVQSLVVRGYARIGTLYE